MRIFDIASKPGIQSGPNINHHQRKQINKTLCKHSYHPALFCHCQKQSHERNHSGLRITQYEGKNLNFTDIPELTIDNPEKMFQVILD